MKEPEVLYTGSRFRVERVFQTMPDGSEHARDIVRHPGAVTILPLLDDGRLCLIENFRPAIGRAMFELPAGTLEPGEDPAEAARRELAEETGYRARHIERLTTFYMSPGILDEKMHLFQATSLEPGSMALEHGEDIRPLLTTWDEVLKMVHDGRICDAKTLCSLLFYQSFRRSYAT